MGSNMAENHPVGFQWVLEARERGAQIIHVDPRFTRTSALASKWVGIRAGSDIAFLGGIINYILEQGRWFDEYVKRYTNAPVVIDEQYEDTEAFDGFFSGWDPDEGLDGEYDIMSWAYQRKLQKDATLEHPRSVFQILKRHFARYTPELVAETCGCTAEEFVAVAEAMCANSGRERTGAIVYSVGWTQHTVGVQIIRAAAIIQLLLGNVGRPGGGVMALRGHASIQGSTDLATLFDMLPGYLPMPRSDTTGGLGGYIEDAKSPAGWWGRADAFIVSLLKAWWGGAATKENDFCFEYLPKIDEDHSEYWTFVQMLDGKVKGYIVAGENPAVGSANSRLHRLGLAQLDWLVVRDLVEVETASFWYDAPELETGELRTDEIPTEVFLLPASSHVEKDGSFTNTQRLVQWHHKAVEPKGDCRSDLWFYYHLGLKLRARLRDSQDPKDRPLLDLTWNYPTHDEHDEPSAEAVLTEMNGWDDEGKALPGYKQLLADGSTASGCWLYAGIYAEGVNQAARKKPRWEQDHVAAEWAWSWPLNRRLLYNRASADPDGKPWSERKQYVWWDAEQKQWTGKDVPDFDEQTSPGSRPPSGAEGPEAISGDQPFIMQPDGLGWLYVPQGLLDGPLPTHYEPHESPLKSPLYSQSANPRRQQFHRPEDPTNSPGEYPYVVTTYRLTEHHTAGGMSRTVPHLSELQPAMFCEVHPELARERGLAHGGWATIRTARAAIEARVLVTDRVKPIRSNGRVVHQVGLPYHWGTRGLTTGGSANDLAHMTLDPNVHIQEVKALTCDIRPGRKR
jgi:formate dehydrogenase major subunit